MLDNSLYISGLIQKKLQNRLTSEEEATLEQWLSANPDNRLLFEQLQNEAWIAEGLEKFKTYDLEKSRSRFNAVLNGEISSSSNFNPNIQPKRSLGRFWVRVSAAAAVIVGIALGTYFLVGTHKTAPVIARVPVNNDISPGANRAILTLGNGSKVILDSAADGSLIKRGNTMIVKNGNGNLTYNSSEETPTDIESNTLSTPRGGQFQLTLPDGTKVWLNAASSITYPTAFKGRNRNVSITGEAYFEVVHSARQPFSVSVNGVQILDIGTHFNINAYPDESTIKTTLLEGKVDLKLSGQSQILMPGEQAQVKNNSTIKLTKDIDLDQVVAWKNNVFDFTDQNFKEVMNQLARWYDLEVQYQGAIPNMEFGGDIPRNLSLKQVLNILDKSSVHFDLNNRTLIIKP